MNLDGKVVVITGANSGIGRSAAQQLAELGARIVMVNRNEQKSLDAIAELKAKTGRDAFDLVLADLAEMDQVRRAAKELRSKYPRIDVLFNNAGVYLPKRIVTKEGREFMFALNHLAPFLLTHELLDNVAAAAPARIITTSSGAHFMGHVDFDDLQAERRFRGLKQYSNTKLMNILFTRELAKRVKSRNIVAHCFHPGGVRTGFAQDEQGLFGFLVKLSGPFLRTPEKAARTATHLASSEDAASTTGEYWANLKRGRPSREARDDAVAARLWEISEKLAGIAQTGEASTGSA